MSMWKILGGKIQFVNFYLTRKLYEHHVMRYVQVIASPWWVTKVIHHVWSPDWTCLFLFLSTVTVEILLGIEPLSPMCFVHGSTLPCFCKFCLTRSFKSSCHAVLPRPELNHFVLTLFCNGLCKAGRIHCQL